MVKVNGGHSIAIYNSAKKGKKDKALKLIEEDRVNIVASADYSSNKAIDKYVKSIINKIELDNKIKKLEK
jgi:hypothetical protein